MLAEFVCPESIEEFGYGVTLVGDELFFVVEGIEDFGFVAVGGYIGPSVDS